MIAPDFLPVWSGIGSYRINLVRHLPRDIEIHIVTTRREIAHSDSNNPSANVASLVDMFGREIYVHPISSARSTFLYHGSFMSACHKHLRQLEKTYKFDLIHSDFPLMSDIVDRVFARTKAVTVSTVHTTIQGQNLAVRRAEKKLTKLDQSDLANLLLLLPLEVCEHIYLKRMQNLIASSNYIKTELQRYFPFVAGKYFPVVHYGIDTQLFHHLDNCRREELQEIRSMDRPVVLFTGRFVASKGIYTLIRAIPMVLRANPKVMFVFVGGGGSRQYAEGLESMGVREENYRFLGYVDYFDMPQVYSLASIFVAPTYYESLPLRILEAMGCGKAIVASAVCGIPEIIDHGRDGILIEPGNHEELAKRIILLLEDDGLTRKLGDRARETVTERFSANRMASKTLDVYKKCLDNRT